MGSSYKLWDKRLRETDLLTRGQIGQYCRSIGAGAGGFEIGGARTNFTHDECVELARLFYDRCRAIDGGGFKLTTEHTEFGIKWLRTAKRAESVDVTADMLDTFQGFRFTDVRIMDVNSWGWARVVPVYRVLSRAGTVDYFWSPWQAKAYA